MNYILLPSARIEKDKWDACIVTSSKPLIYATYTYMNYVCDNWMGFVFDDYKAVMPVAIRKKYKLTYLYDVPFIQQLGLFGNDTTHDMIGLLTKTFRYGDYAFYNAIQTKHAHLSKHNNYVLSLENNYEAIADAYKEDLKKNLKKAEKLNLSYSQERAEVAVRLYQKHYSHRFKHVAASDFKNVLRYCNSTNNYIVRAVKSEEGSMLAITLLLSFEGRLYNIMNSTLSKGRNTEANHFLIDNIIKEFSGRYKVLDLEGSDLPGVELFYKKFGAANEPYNRVHINRLPFPLNLLKR